MRSGSPLPGFSQVTLSGTREAPLRELAERLGDRAHVVTANLGDAAEVEALPKKAAEAMGAVDILVNNNGGPPLRDFRQVDEAAMLAGLQANMIAPVDLVQRVIDGMVERRFGRIVNITSASVKMPLPMLDLSSGARAGLTGFLGGVARQVAGANVTINFLLPGAFDTDRLNGSMERESAARGVDKAQLAEERRKGIPAGRFGTPEEFGAACAFLCSAQAGYITGQSLLIDGGTYPGIV